VTAPDFEIKAAVRARSMTTHVPPDAETEGEEVSLTRRESRSGLPPQVDPGGRYDDVEVEKELIGEQFTPPTDQDSG
jgi:hypothetical protein